jgi:hypothetical protein
VLYLDHENPESLTDERAKLLGLDVAAGQGPRRVASEESSEALSRHT